MFFHLHIVYLYTNLNFTDKQREDEAKIYDTLASTGLLTSILENIPESEYEILYDYLEELERVTLKYKTTIGGIIQDVVDTLPVKAEEMQKL